MNTTLIPAHQPCLADLFAALFEPEDLVELRTLGTPAKRHWLHAAQVSGFMNPIPSSWRGLNITFGVNPRRQKGGMAADVLLARCLFADFDHVEADEAIARIARAGLPVPTALVASGGGIHAYWRLRDPFTDLAVWRLRQKASIAALESDRAVHDAPRMMRLPGTLNHKYNPPRRCELLECSPGNRYELTQFPLPLAPPSLHLQPPTPVWSGSNSDLERRAAAYLDSMEPAISGQGGHNKTYAAARAMVRGFALEPTTALRLLICRYNPRCKPPWTERELMHKVTDATTKPHNRPFGWLRDAPASLGEVRPSQTGRPRSDVARPPFADPGLLPPESFRVPGFIGEVMDHCLRTAPYPNPTLAFCGALALQAVLAGRAVRDPGDNRTNIYLLGLAHSAAGKDWPRKINARVLSAVGLSDQLGDRFASGEGIQDAMYATPAMLMQTDEIDGLLQSINRARDARFESIMSTLLTMYSASNSVFPMRRKAGRSEPGLIHQPCLVLFGTAIPNHYFAALSERMLTNGLFARMLILEAGPRCAGQDAVISDLPDRVLTTARWWAELQSRSRNPNLANPTPRIVELTEEAGSLLSDLRLETERAYSEAESRGDAVATTVWGRANEHARKLGLLYAVSENHTQPAIGGDAVRWASRLVMHQTRRMLFMASSHSAESPFDEQALKTLRYIRETPDGVTSHSTLLKRMKMDARSFHDLISTLTERGDICARSISTGGRSLMTYRLAEKEGEESGKEVGEETGY